MALALAMQNFLSGHSLAKIFSLRAQCKRNLKTSRNWMLNMLLVDSWPRYTTVTPNFQHFVSLHWRTPRKSPRKNAPVGWLAHRLGKDGYRTFFGCEKTKVWWLHNRMVAWLISSWWSRYSYNRKGLQDTCCCFFQRQLLEHLCQPPFKCTEQFENGNVCTKSYPTHQQLDQHVRGIHAEGFVTYCDKRYTWPLGRHQHQQECHKCKKLMAWWRAIIFLWLDMV